MWKKKKTLDSQNRSEKKMPGDVALPDPWWQKTLQQDLSTTGMCLWSELGTMRLSKLLVKVGQMVECTLNIPQIIGSHRQAVNLHTGNIWAIFQSPILTLIGAKLGDIDEVVAFIIDQFLVILHDPWVTNFSRRRLIWGRKVSRQVLVCLKN